MSETETGPYSLDAQNGIFNLLFVLIREYRMSGLSQHEAVNKACSWLVSLSEAVVRSSEISEKGDSFKDSIAKEK